MFAASVFLGVNVGPTARISPELMQAAQKEISGTAQMYIKELWNLPIASILIGFVVYFIGGYFLYSSFYAAIGAAVDNQTDSQQFLLPIIMPLMLSVYIGFFTVINDPHGSSGFFNDSTYFTYRNANANSVWRTFVANSHISNAIIC